MNIDKVYYITRFQAIQLISKVHYSKVMPKRDARLKEGLKAGYLVSVLNALGNNPVDIRFDDALNAESQPHLFSSPDADGVKCVIMPVRVGVNESN